MPLATPTLCTWLFMLHWTFRTRRSMTTCTSCPSMVYLNMNQDELPLEAVNLPFARSSRGRFYSFSFGTFEYPRWPMFLSPSLYHTRCHLSPLFHCFRWQLTYIWWWNYPWPLGFASPFGWQSVRINCCSGIWWSHLLLPVPFAADAFACYCCL